MSLKCVYKFGRIIIVKWLQFLFLDARKHAAIRWIRAQIANFHRLIQCVMKDTEIMPYRFRRYWSRTIIPLLQAIDKSLHIMCSDLR